MIDYDSFFSLVDIKDDEIGAAKEYINFRGLQEHIDMATYLASFIKDRKPTYQEVATSFRYDKRIRRILFKYIGLLEEYFRAYICNHFSSPKELEIKTEESLYEYSSKALLSRTVENVWKLEESNKNELFEGRPVLFKNLNALVVFRNAVSHNRTLLTYRDFEEVTLKDKSIGNSFLFNLNNLKEILPYKIAISFKQEINNASYVGKKRLPNQVSWSLPPFIRILIK